jgi:hypothetical protein
MTLVLTELGPLGITMAADSAVTITNRRTNQIYAVPNLARKLQMIPYLKGGISCWGKGKINNQPTDKWLADFISSNSEIDNLQDFANELAAQLNTQIPANTSGETRLGFHIAAFEDYNGRSTPSFYHVHDGPSQALQQQGIEVNPYQFNANHDCTPELFIKRAKGNQFLLTRNGDYQIYARLFATIESFFHQLRDLGIIIPNSQDLNDRAAYLVFQIRTMSEIYKLSNLIPGIGGAIYYLTINKHGIHSEGTKQF